MSLYLRNHSRKHFMVSSLLFIFHSFITRWGFTTSTLFLVYLFSLNPSPALQHNSFTGNFTSLLIRFCFAFFFFNSIYRQKYDIPHTPHYSSSSPISYITRFSIHVVCVYKCNEIKNTLLYRYTVHPTSYFYCLFKIKGSRFVLCLDVYVLDWIKMFLKWNVYSTMGKKCTHCTNDNFTWITLTAIHLFRFENCILQQILYYYRVKVKGSIFCWNILSFICFHYFIHSFSFWLNI